MKASKTKGANADSLKIRALKWATLAVAAQRSECFILDGTMTLGERARESDFIRWRFDRAVRFGQVPEEGASCLRSIEETVFLRLLVIQSGCFVDLLNGRDEDPAHFMECRSLMEAYVERHGERMRIPAHEMINRGLYFLSRNWRSIRELSEAILVAPGRRMRDVELSERLQHLLGPADGGFLLDKAAPQALPSMRLQNAC